MNKNLRKVGGLWTVFFTLEVFLLYFVFNYYLGLHLLDFYESSNLEEKQIKVLEIQVGNKYSNESYLVTEINRYITS